MTMLLLEAAHVAEGIPSGANIALKPNLVMAGTPESGATTHAGVLSGCMEYFRSYGFRELSVIEGSWVGAQTGRAFQACGYDRVCERYQVPFYDLKKDSTRVVETPLRPMEICERALDADYLINLPVLKGHCQTVMTCALKNCKGCIPDHEKRRFHSEGLMRPIAALAAALRPDLTIVDSICGDLNFEEGGTPVQTNRMYLGTDPVQLDAYGCKLMGLSPEDVPYIGYAESWGAGTTKLADGEIVRLNEPQGSGEYTGGGLVKRLTKNIREDRACSACYASLVRGIYVAQEKGISVPSNIAIGQGWRGREFPGLGIGTCCSGAEKCVQGCPPSADDVVRALEMQQCRRNSGRR